MFRLMGSLLTGIPFFFSILETVILVFRLHQPSSDRKIPSPDEFSVGVVEDRSIISFFRDFFAVCLIGFE